jgi:hypothetical protein
MREEPLDEVEPALADGEVEGPGERSFEGIV